MEEEKKPKNPYTEARKSANDKWDKANCKTFGTYMPNALFDEMTATIETMKKNDPSMTRGKFVREAVTEKIERVRADMGTDQTP